MTVNPPETSVVPGARQPSFTAVPEALTPGGELVLVGLGPAAEDVAHAGADVLERVDPEHPLG